MSETDYARVRVIVDLEKRTVRCEPDPVKCYWVAGPANIRWTFGGVPLDVDTVVIEWLKTNNQNYKNKPMFRGQGVSPSTSGSHICDIVTFGNIKEKGKFKYAVYCLDKGGNIVAEADPEGDNDDIPLP